MCCILVTGQGTGHELRIVAFGNSTTAERKNVEKVYAQRLPDLLAKLGVEAWVINRGIGGSHSGLLTDNDHHKVPHALDRFQTDVLDEHPDIVIIQFGINDSYIDSDDPEGQSRISLDKFFQNLSFMVRELKNEEIKVILLTPNALGANKEQWRNERLEQYVEVIRKLASEQNVPYLDPFALYREYDNKTGQQSDDLLFDGVHPNDKGHEILAGMLAEMIYSLYKNHEGILQ